MITVEGAYDLHIHSAPCLFPRIADDLTIAEAAQAAGLRGVVLKSHHESTVGRAAVVNRTLERTNPAPLIAYGSITLNHAVGGVNPTAVEAALKTGARMVWFPTIDSAAHSAAYGHTGSWDVQGRDNPAPRLEPLSILQDRQLTGTAQAVVKLCQQYGVALATGHLGRDEIFALAHFAHQEGFHPLVITHPNFKVPHLDNRDLSELATFDVYFEFTYCTVSPMWRSATIDETAAAIQTVGAERCFLTSDGGQPHNPMPHEGLRLLAQMLLEKGIGEAAIGQMIRDIPARLLCV